MATIIEETTKQPNTDIATCGSCGHAMRRFFDVRGVPSNSCILMDSPEEARAYPRGDIVLGFCDACGLIANMAFDARLAEYSARYEETQGFSPTFNRFHQAQAQNLIDSYDIRGKSVLEIGCGKGEFLALLCSLGSNTGLGFDPGYDPKRGVLADVPGVRVVQDFYSDRYASDTADLVCCKMTLEHIPRTADFVKLSKQAMRADGSSIVYFQVPNVARILKECAFEDVYYEHCSYFTPGSLARLFRSQGFDILDLRTEYNEQYLAIEAKLARKPSTEKLAEEDDLPFLREQVASFSTRCGEKIGAWKDRLQSSRSLGPTVLWGSGSKAVSFLGIVDSDRIVENVVDINPFRQGHYMPSTAQPILAPEALSSIRPTTVIAMNTIYREEINALLAQMGLTPKLLAL